MMTPTQLGHARIAGNVERLLSDALDISDPTRVALQNIGVDLGLAAETLAVLGRAAGYAPSRTSAWSMPPSTSNRGSLEGSTSR